MALTLAKQYKPFISVMIFIIAFLLLLFVTSADADDLRNPISNNALIFSPTRCIALHQGQSCYQTIDIHWQTIQIGDYCLYQQESEPAIYCWKSQQQGQLRYDFVSNSTLLFQLVDMKEKKPVSEIQVEVAWVYKANTRRKTHWRLF